MGKIGPFVGLDLEIGLFVGIGPLVGIGLFGGTGPVVSLTYIFKKIIGNPNFSNLFKRIVNRFKRAGYTLDIMRQTACLVSNPIMVEGYAALFSCTAVVQASESMTASM